MFSRELTLCCTTKKSLRIIEKFSLNQLSGFEVIAASRTGFVEKIPEAHEAQKGDDNLL